MKDETVLQRWRQLKAEVFVKYAQGVMLNEFEFEVAKEGRLWQDDEVTMEALEALHYQADEREGWLCAKVGSTRMEKPKKGFTVCTWGIHAYEVDPEALTNEQVAWFAHYGWTSDQLGSGDSEQVPAGEVSE